MIRIKIGNNEPKIIDEKEISDFTSAMDILPISQSEYSVLYKNRSHVISILSIDKLTKTMNISIDGISSIVHVSTKMDLLLEKMGIDTTSTQKLTALKSPMPGLVIEWMVNEGDKVITGDKLLILEAMKMENVIKSPGDGVIKKIYVEQGLAVEKNQLLIEFQ